MRLELDAVEALDAVIRYGGFARAAVRLHKVQSAVSYQVRKLEEQLGVPLLDRKGYRVRLTAAGEAVLAQGQRLLAQARHVEAVARQFAEGWEARLLVIVDGILPVAPTLAAFKQLADEGAPTRCQLKVEFQRGVQFCFERDQADLMVVKDYEAKPYLATEELPAVECVLCARRGHPLAALEAVRLDDLQDHVELSVQDSSGRPDDPHGFGGERVFYLSGFDAKKQALLMGAGFGWMPLAMIRAELRSGRLRELRYAGGSRYRFIPRLVHRLDAPPGRAGRRIAQLLREATTAASPSGPDGAVPAPAYRRRRPLPSTRRPSRAR